MDTPCGIPFRSGFKLKYDKAPLNERCLLCGCEVMRVHNGERQYVAFALPGYGGGYCFACERLIRDAKRNDIVQQWHEWWMNPERTLAEKRLGQAIIDHANRLTFRNQPIRTAP